MGAMAGPLPQRFLRPTAIALVAVGLLLTLQLDLVAALLSGLLVHELVHAIAPRLAFGGMRGQHSRLLTVGLIATLVIGALISVLVLAVAFLRSGGGTPAELLARMADIIEASRASLPAWISEQLPADADSLSRMLVDWMRVHAKEVQLFGRSLGLGFAHVLLGMVIGAIICAREARGAVGATPLAREIETRIALLAHSFRSVVFAQVKISAVNTVLTAIYLLGLLPMMGIHLPLAKTLVAVTFVAGLLPVLGNLVSNTIIVVVSLSHSFHVAGLSLAFLIAVHKLEYFLNARIVGGEIKAAAWELLVAMLVMEAAFGLPGLVAAPVFYAYLKREMKEMELL
jgi:predicted PurR-regulated permease PerM